jgi:Flp pilus assembly protein TadD
MNRAITGFVATMLLLSLVSCAPKPQASSTADQLKSRQHLDQAIEAVRQGRVGQAQELLDQAISADPGNADAFNNKGNVLMASGKYQLAIAEYSSAIKLQGNRSSYIFNRGYALLLAGDYREALKDLNRVVEEEPMNVKALAFRGQVRANLSDYEGAIADFDRVVALAPGNGEAYANRGVIKAQLGRNEAAKDDFSKAEVVFRKAGDRASLAKLITARSALKGAQKS